MNSGINPVSTFKVTANIDYFSHMIICLQIMKNYASYNSLMKHMRENKKIKINGSDEKSKLKRIGYYHGVKGYRFYNKSSNPITYQSFNEMWNVISFDEELKAILYQPIMQLEIAIKSYACNDIIEYTQSSNFSDIFEKGFDKDLSKKEKKYRTRDNIYMQL